MATDVTASLALKGDLSLVNSVIASDALKAPLTGANMIGPITMNTGASGKTCSVVGALDIYGLFTVHGVGNMIGLGTQWPASPIDIVGNTNIAGNLNVNNGGIYKLNGIDIFSTI